VSEDRRNERSTRARAVADAPIDALLDRGEELARRWAIALILERPLAEMADVPLEDLARDAPGVCAQVVRALDSDVELERIAASEGSRGRSGAAPAVRLGALDARATVEHIEALRGVIWEALIAMLDNPSARQVADLSDRLAFVCSTLLAAALGESAAMTAHETLREAPPSPRGEVLYTAPQSAPGRRGVALIDEFEDAVAQSPRRADAEAERERRARAAGPQGTRAPHEPARAYVARAAGADASRTAPRPLPWDTPLQPADTTRAADERDARRAREAAQDVVRVSRRAAARHDDRS
jgi:hypothetical protein